MTFPNRNRADLTAANVLFSSPMILPITSSGLDLPSYKCTSAPKGPIVATVVCPDYTIDFSVISTSMTATFTNLRFLSFVLELKHPFSIAYMDSMWYSDKLYLAQRDLVYLSLKPEQTALDTACCIAASIYADSYLRDLGFRSGVIAVMITRLKQFLEKVIFETPDGDSEDRPITLFWILVIGGIAAVDKPEQEWFIGHLQSLRDVMDLDNRVDAEDTLRKILWTKDWSRYLDAIIAV